MKKSHSKLPRVRISIRYKILLVVGLLLVAAVSFYTLLASSIFREEKTALLYDINHSTAVNAAAQIRSAISGLANQIHLYTLSRIAGTAGRIRLPKDFLTKSNISELRAYKKTGNTFLPIGPGFKEFTLKDLSSFLVLAEQNQYAVWSLPAAKEQTYFFGTKLELEQNGVSQTRIVVAIIDPVAFFRPMQSATLFGSYLLDARGKPLVFCDREKRLHLSADQIHPVFERIQKQPKGQSGVASYSEKGEDWYGAFAPVGAAGLHVVSQASRLEVNSALDNLLQRSLLFGLITITATFLVSILFSKSLTHNLHRLTVMAQQIGKGDLRSKIKIRSLDEVENLAASFNLMIDELRESRDAIEKHNKELEQKVAERTKELQQKNLAIEEIQEKLLQSTQLAAAGEVAGQTAHEVLNPLTAIIGRLEKLRDQTLQEQTAPKQLSELLSAWREDFDSGGIEGLKTVFQKPSSLDPSLSLFEEDLNNLNAITAFWRERLSQRSTDLSFIGEQAGRIQRIVDGMRNMIRPSDNREHLFAHEAIDQAALTLTDLLEKHDTEIKKQYESETDAVEVNSDALIQILTNLIRNAFQAIEQRRSEGPVHGVIQIRTLQRENTLVVEIIDNGAGIQADHQESIFKQGFTTKPADQGTGLGLAICRRYARAFGGDVKLSYSRPESFETCFEILIPLAKTKPLKIAV